MAAQQSLSLEDLAAWLRLTQDLSRAATRRLLAQTGSAQAALERAASCGQVSAHGTSLQAQLLPTTWQWLQQAPEGLVHAIITLADPRYPQALLETADPPLLLYVVGAQRFFSAQTDLFPAQRALAIVGCRNPSAQGAIDAQAFAHALCTAGLCIVSGMALGIDAAAHLGALEAAQAGCSAGPATIAVMGAGLDQVYPRSHRALAQRIAHEGLLLSEYPLGSPPLPAHFPQRNRIIAGLAQGTLVVEAALASGSLITARLAAEQGREVFALPGSIHSPRSRGCHALLREGAKLVETAQDVLDELQGLAQRPLARAPKNPDAQAPANKAQTQLLSALGFAPLGLDALVARTGWDAAHLQVLLLELELAGRVARLPGGLFQRIERC